MSAIKLKKILPLILALGCLWFILYQMLTASISLNQGNFVYTHDDAYIHMAMAKNFSQHGTWGVTRHEFTSSSSSLLWTMMLSLIYWLGGVSEATPFILNFFLATVQVLVLFTILSRLDLGFTLNLSFLLGFILFIPLPFLVFTGLEHIMQILINTLFIYFVIETFPESRPAPEDKTIKKELMLGILAMLTVMTRYEGLFLVLAIILVFLQKKNYRKAAIILVSGTLPVVGYGIFSVMKGWHFFPNSVLLKGNRPSLDSLMGIMQFIYFGLRQIIYNIHILVIILILFFLIYNGYRKIKGQQAKILTTIFTLSVLQHMFFAKTSLFLNSISYTRYDSYLIAIGLLAILYGYFGVRGGIISTKSPSVIHRSVLTIITILFLLPLGERAIRIVVKTAQGTNNIYLQQYQMAKFIKRYYHQEKVIINDIGAINFYANIHCLDIWGLGSKETGDTILKHGFNQEVIEKITKVSGARIAVVYEQVFYRQGGIPPSWHKVAEWEIKGNYFCAYDTVSFFSLESAETPRLTRSLLDFTPQLPKPVIQRLF